MLFVEPYVPVATIENSLRETDLLRRRRSSTPTSRCRRSASSSRADTRLVVLAEQDGGERPWYLDGFRFVQDTPLGATRPSQLSCDRFRGEPTARCSCSNHWIPPFPPSVTRNQAIGGGVPARADRALRAPARDAARTCSPSTSTSARGVVGIARDLNAEQP